MTKFGWLCPESGINSLFIKASSLALVNHSSSPLFFLTCRMILLLMSWLNEHEVFSFVVNGGITQQEHLSWCQLHKEQVQREEGSHGTWM